MANSKGPSLLDEKSLSEKVTDPSSAIRFIANLKSWCFDKHIGWWYQIAMNEFPSDDAKSEAEVHKDNARLLSIRLEQDVATWLQPARPLPTPARLNMNAEETPQETPAVASTPSPAPATSTIRMPTVVNGMYTLDHIETAVCSMVGSVTSTSFVDKLRIPASTSGTLALSKLRRIFTPTSAAAKATAKARA